MKKIFVVALIFISYYSKSQYKTSFADNLYFGGGLGFSYSSTVSNVNISPLVGYNVIDDLSFGVGVIYQYNKYNKINLELHHYGGSIFSRYLFLDYFFATVEYEYLFIQYPVFNTIDFNKVDEIKVKGFPSVFVGGGYVAPIGGNASFTIAILYNLLYSEKEFESPYSSPYIIRAGFNVGF